MRRLIGALVFVAGLAAAGPVTGQEQGQGQGQGREQGQEQEPGQDTSASSGPVTEHFRFVADAGSEGLTRHLAGIAEDKRRYVLGVLGARDDRTIEVRVASSEAEMERAVGTDRPVREWIAGLAISRRNLIVISARGNEFFTASDTFLHELAHIYLDAAVGGRSVPRWFHEGVAMLVAPEHLGERLKSLLGAAATGSFLGLEDLDERFPSDGPSVHLAYAQSMGFLRFLQKRGGLEALRGVLALVRSGVPFGVAFEQTWGAPPEDLWSKFERQFDPLSSALFFVASASAVWFLILFLFLFVLWRKQHRAALKVRAWEIEDQLALLPEVPGPEEIQ